MDYGTQPQPRNWWKIISLILIVIGVLVACYFLYGWIYADGYNQGFEQGSAYVINYQTQNQKIFLFNQTGSPLELNYQQLFDLLQRSADG